MSTEELAEIPAVPYAFEDGYWNRAGGSRWEYRGETWYCHHYETPVRNFHLTIDTCQGFNREVGRTTTMHAVVVEAEDRRGEDPVVDYPCYATQFPTARDAAEAAAEVMRAVDRGEYDASITDGRARGRATRLANLAGP